MHPVVLAEIELIKAEMALSQRNFSEAKTRSQVALSARSTPYAIPIEAKFTLGLTSVFQKAGAEGEKLCNSAVEAAAKAGDVALLSRSQLALATAQLANGNARGALTTAVQAQQRLALTGQQESEWRALAIAGQASRALHDDSGARQQLKQAANLLSQLQQSWGAEAFNRYIARPDIHTLVQESGLAV